MDWIFNNCILNKHMSQTRKLFLQDTAKRSAKGDDEEGEEGRSHF